MPVTPRAARRRSSTPQNANSPQYSASKVRPNSLYDPSSVQDRIRQWQAHGAADALDPDAISVRSTPLSDHTHEPSRPQSPADPAPKSAPQRPNRLADKENRDQARDASTSSAPRKRLISDEHWKAKKKDGGEKSPRAALKDAAPTPHYDLSYTSNQRREEREARRERRKQARLSRENATRNSEGIDTRDFASPPPVVQDLDSYIDKELARRLGTPSMQDDAESEDCPRQRRKSKYTESLGHTEAPSCNDEPVKSKSKGAAVFFKTKEIFGRYEKPVSNRVPSIEAWLDEQPDPFIDNEPENEVPAVEMPEPLRKRTKRSKRRSGAGAPSDPNKNWNSVTVCDGEQGESPRKRDSSWSYGDEALARNKEPPADPSEDSPFNLHRSAARVRRSRYEKPSPQPSSRMDNPACQPLSPSPPVPSQQKLERSFLPTGGHRLSAIASIETFKDNNDPPQYDVLPSLDGPGLKRKLTTHEDLMSVLSLPMNRKSTRSRRRAKPQPLQSATEVLASLVVEEDTYGKELRTLVDGVIPVLLQCVLSKSDSVAAAGLFTSSVDGKDDLAFTKPIIDMGVALERLKSLHNRIPLQNIDPLLGWAHNTQKAYNDYLTAWRLGFQDVVVNLAPLEHGQELKEGMSRDADGDVVNAEGKKVDVAYLLKRPLVRVKNLSKTFEAIKEHSERTLAQEVAQMFADLTALAKRRHQEEQARLEDEAAARIDPTRARDLRTLGATTKAFIDPSRRVRARDCFNLTIYHSTGQRLDCHVEMILRDNPSSTQPGGDVLICEVDESGKWLLFPPVELHSVSARRAEQKFDLVMMIRGPSGIGQEWHELLALSSDSPEAATEWMAMVGSNPLPPKLNRTQSFREPEKAPSIIGTLQGSGPGGEVPPVAVGERDVPLGEPSILGNSDRPTSRGRSNNPFERFMPRLNLGGGLQSKPQRVWQKQEKAAQRKPVPSIISSGRSSISDQSTKELPRLPKASSAPSTPAHGPHTKPARRLPPSTDDSDLFMMSGALPVRETNSSQAQHDRKETDPDVVYSKTHHPEPLHHLDQTRDTCSAPATPATTPAGQRPDFARKLSATPSMDLPTVNKLREASGQDTAQTSMPLNESIRDQWNALSGDGRSRRRSGHKPSSRSQLYTEDIPSPPNMTSRALPAASTVLQPIQPNLTSPRHQESTKSQMQSAPVAPEPQLKPTPKEERARKRRSSSPLKHEYAPSTASESSSDSDSEGSNDSSSETSEDFMSETKDVAMPLVAVTAGNRRSSRVVQQSRPPPSVAPTTRAGTLAPSDSASQGPYRQVPASSTVPGSKTSKTIAMVCSWSNKGLWEQIFPDECSIVISPGLIEAFEMSAAHSGARDPGTELLSNDPDSRASSMTQQPLVAFELTPIVPLRRGTALDINIRSPPTANSKLRTTNNIMFRSRNADECDALYAMINWARCNNPTYIQLQNARPRQPSVTFNVGGAQHARTKSGSWFSFGGSEKQSSYRASSAPAPGSPSVGGDSEASVGTMNSAISALKRLGVSSAFNLGRSSVTRKSGLSRTSGSLYSSDSGTRAGSGSSTPQPSQLGLVPGKDGPNVPETSAEAANGGGMVNNMKIRLYVRKGQGWENLGSGRLTVMPAEEMTPGGGNSGQSTPTGPLSRAPSGGVVGQPGGGGPRLPSSSHTPHRVHGNGREKRIMVRKNKDNGLVLLDATLGESCFERVMQTGIAVKVWEEDAQIADRGGVVMGREKIFMMQFPGAREAGWVFGLCGTYRYRTE